jgi:hypothetical protein
MTGCMRARLLAGGAAGALALIGLGSGAAAQSIDPSTTFNPDNAQATTFDRGENVSVRERPRPEYQAAGLHLGGFMVYPKLTASGTYDDNIYALEHHAVGDEVFSLVPEIDLQSTWSRNAIAAYVRAQQDLYVKHASENSTQYGAGLSGKFQFGESDLTGGVDYGHYVLPRTAANNISSSNPTISGISKHRIPYDYTALHAQLAHTFNRLRLAARADYQIYDYQNGETANGVTVFEKDQNHKVATYAGKAEYAISPNTAFFVYGAYNDRRYDLNPPTPGILLTRDSDGYDLGAGINFDLTHLVRGEVQLGYIDQHYKSHLFKDIKGLSAKGQVEWFPTQLTTLTLTALRSVGDSGIIGSAGFLTTTGAIQVDHELMRNVILTANATYGQDQYSGIDRTDDHWGAGVSANWLLNRRVGLTFSYTYLNQRSFGASRGPSFGDSRLTVATVLQF